MTKRHYKIRKDLSIEHEGKKLYRIEATKNIKAFQVKKGDLGGFIESYNNLTGNAWVGDNAMVWDNAIVTDNACVCCNARVWGDTFIFDNAFVGGAARIKDSARIYGNARVIGNAEISGNAVVFGFALVLGHAKINKNAAVSNRAWVGDRVVVTDNAKILGNAFIFDNAIVLGGAVVTDNAKVCGKAKVSGDAFVGSYCRIYDDEIQKASDVYNLVTGYGKNVTITPKFMEINRRWHTHEDWLNFTNYQVSTCGISIKWWRQWKSILKRLCKQMEKISKGEE